MFIEAARARQEALDHVLFVGPPGLGKTTLAQIVARELGVNFRATSGPVIAKAGDLAALLTNLEPRDVLFIDEIHRLNPAVEEILYPAMEDFQLDLIIGEGPAARSVKIDLAPFTLVGATTRAGLLTNPLRDRFGIPVRLNFYTEAELELIVTRGARVLGIGMTPDGANEIARRARGTPRIAGRLLRRVRDFAHVDGDERDRPQGRRPRASALEVDAAGLDAMDRRYLTHHRGELWRRAGRRRDHGRRVVGAARCHRGHHRAVSDPAGLRAAHAARTPAHRRGVQASRPAGARRAIRASSGCLGKRKMSSAASAEPPSTAKSSTACTCQPVRVYYEDTDFSGVVYHASYLRFMERGRTNYLRLLGADHRAMFEQAADEAPGFAFVVRHMDIDFKKPALHGRRARHRDHAGRGEGRFRSCSIRK